MKKPLIISLIVIAVLLLLGAAAWGYQLYWLYQQPKFHDITMELGASVPGISEFFTEYAKAEKAEFVTSLSELDLTKTGSHDLTLRHGGKEETVKLTVVDTTPPTAQFRDCIAHIDNPPGADDFVEDAFDLSGTTVSFVKEPEALTGYGDTLVEILVCDGNGNSIVGTCKLSYVWMRESFTLELGQTLLKSDLLMDMKDEALLVQADLDKINTSPVGTYSITSSSQGQTCTCTVTVQDTTPPQLVLKPISMYPGGKAVLEDFVESAWDISGEVTLQLLTTLNFKEYGVQTVTVEAKDINGNITTEQTTLEILRDTTVPYISGLSTIEIEKNGTPDYETGVRAYDERDGEVAFTYDASKVDLTKAGNYFVTYSATDRSGNTGVFRRKVSVAHDAQDTAELLASVAAGLGSDPKAIRNYVMNNIRYNSGSWGGSDPVWHGLTERNGNCYVYAHCLKALLGKKGYSAQLIWTTDRSHYWVIVNINGSWKHMDSTPGTGHSKYLYMSDEQRLETLNGRKWDTSAWPTCE